MSVIDKIHVKDQNGTEQVLPIGADAVNVTFDPNTRGSLNTVNSRIQDTIDHINKKAVTDSVGIHGMRYNSSNNKFEIETTPGQQSPAGGGGEGDMTKAEFVNPQSNLLLVSKGGTGNANGYVQIGASVGSTIGNKATAEGENTYSSGITSHAEGNGSIAIGNYSHAEGYATNAIGYGAHCEGGYSTATSDLYIKAYGDNSHAEGLATYAVGKQSHAEGVQTTAKGANSHAEGGYTYASDGLTHAEGYYTYAGLPYAHAEGYYTTANGRASHTEGGFRIQGADYEGVKAVGQSSHAEGVGTSAVGHASHAEGVGTSAVGHGSHTEGGYGGGIGSGTLATGLSSHAEGNMTTADGSESHAEGNHTYALGKASHSEGQSTTASNFASHAGGHYNAAMTTGGTSSNIVGTAFVIGNGTSSSNLSNAFAVEYDGTISPANSVTPPGSDYAEFFEQNDSNINNEDRAGYFVTFDNGKKIKIASSEDDYILGIVSGAPSVIGNGDCHTQTHKEMRDEFNRIQYEPAPLYELNKETGEYEQVLDDEGNPVYQGIRPIFNPEYDSSQPYISRRERPEWAAVGMLGVLPVRDDGTCEINGYCTVAEGGIATKATNESVNKYRVIGRKTENVVEIVFR